VEQQFYIGLVLFAIGFLVNIQSDQILLTQKKMARGANNNDKGSLSKYVIPRGGLFEYVSCANYCKLQNI